MKKIILLVTACLIINITHAQALSIKIYEIKKVVVESGFTTNITGAELNNFQVPATANSVKLSMQIRIKPFQPYRLSNQLRLMITNTATGEVLQNAYWSPLYKDTTLISACYFPAGDYAISLVDEVKPATVFASRTITVKSNGIAGDLRINGYTYSTSRFKLWTCKSVDETNWKPVGVINKIKLGACLTFFFESSEKIKNPGTLRWKLYMVDASGKETFVNQHDQTSVLEEWRRMYYEECNDFQVRGKYRMYIAVKNESEAYYGVRDTAYFAKADFVVE